MDDFRSSQELPGWIVTRTDCAGAAVKAPTLADAVRKVAEGIWREKCGGRRLLAASTEFAALAGSAGIVTARIRVRALLGRGWWDAQVRIYGDGGYTLARSRGWMAGGGG